MKVINDSARTIWIRLPALSGAVVVTNPDDQENARPIGPMSDLLASGEVSREYPELHREMLLSTPGLREYAGRETPEPKAAPVVEEPRALEDENIDLTPTTPKVAKKTKKEERPKRGRGRRKI